MKKVLVLKPSQIFGFFSPGLLVSLPILLQFFLFPSCRYSQRLPYEVEGMERGDSAMVVTAHPLASDIGLQVLRAGGNAIDAVVATQFALAVVYPRAGNIGGGGFLVYRDAGGKAWSLDFREKAPGSASRDMYLDSLGRVIGGLSTRGHLSVGVPGSVMGLWEAHQRFGRLPWASLLDPAIRLARKGYPITATEAERLNRYLPEFREWNTLPNAFTRKQKWRKGDRLVQEDLAGSLERIRLEGPAGFYAGETAALLVAEMKRGGGLITPDDLNNYRAVWREPVVGQFRDFRVWSMPPPSSGGVALVQLLKMAETFPLKEWGLENPATYHALVECMRRVYADRARFLGDSDFYPVPIDSLLDERYLKRRLADFRPDRASPSDSTSAGNFRVLQGSFETTHTSIFDQAGNAVSLTTTINSNYGSKVVVGGGGFFLNNEMDDFSAKPGVPNLYGLVGSEANAIAPNKRMLSAMTPTIVEKNGKPFLVIGTPGGSTIITSVFQVILYMTDFQLSLEEAVARMRFHHQWLPDEIWYESGALSGPVLERLREMGHQLLEKERIAKIKAIHILPNGQLIGVGDPRLGEDDAEGY